MLTFVLLLNKMRDPRIIYFMLTIIETPTFQRQVDKIWSEDELLNFISWIAKNPTAGDVIPKADGARKIRWSAGNKGKRGGVRVIYFNQIAQGLIYLITIYPKSQRENMSAKEINKVL